MATENFGYVSKCIKAGFKCSDCEHLVLCVGADGSGDGGHFTQIPLNVCNNTENRFCSVPDGGCVADKKVCRIFGLQQINCQNAGIFPDPYDCTTYHICTADEKNRGLTSNRYRCDDGKAFDALTKTCRHNLEHRVCKESPITACVRALQYGPLIENPNIYYVCIRTLAGDLEPRLYKCDDGKLFDTTTFNCVDDKNASTNSTSSSDELHHCSEKGLFPDEHNCYRYYLCDDHLKSFRKTCRPGSHFNSTSRSCVKGKDC